jgi:hypothetical protein
MAAGQPTVSLQGVETPNVSVDPDSFFKFTRRLRFPMRSLSTFAGFGSNDSVSLRQTGVVSKLFVRVRGTITATAGAALTAEYPHNIVRAFRVSANGQSNLINANGAQIKALNIMGNPGLSSKGVGRNVGVTAATARTTTSGTLGLASEDWGTNGTASLGPSVTALTAVAYTVDVIFEVPLAYDDKYLTGAIYAQTNATQLTLDIDWANASDITAAGTLTPSLQYSVVGEVFSIPNVSGRYVVPDLSAFHSLIGFRQTGLAQGDNEALLPGTGVGRQLMRLYGQVYTGTAPGTPLVVNDANFSQLGWRYGGNDTPEIVPGGGTRFINEYDYNDDLGASWGFWCYDFATAWAFRDAVDQGATTDLRAVIGLVGSPTNGVARIVQETIFAAPVGA